jgi:putative component of toxin-antitoxin plasmid stabilization module
MIMKKLAISIIIYLSVLIVISCTSKKNNLSKTDSLAALETKVSNSQITIPANSLTLNGIPFSTADSMVKRFHQNQGIYDTTARTSIWFSNSVFHGMDSLLIAQKADGLRIYFAKKADNKYAIVVVSTAFGGLDTDKVTKIHNDQFQLSGEELYAKNTTVNGEISYGASNQGALLYSNNPGCPPIGKDGCDASKPHYITCQKAFAMVNKYGNDKINATSEWFDTQIIKELDSSLTVQKGDGLRIYFARRLEIDQNEASDTVHRHGFVLITTQLVGNIHKDYYDCFLIRPQILRPQNGMKAMHLTKGTMKIIDGGSDNGEQCPDNCTGAKLP